MMRAAVLMVASLAIGCGDGNPYPPAGPSSVIPPLPPPNATGRWDGVLSLDLNDRPASTQVMLRLTHAGSEMAGTWSAQVSGVGSGTGGTIAGEVRQDGRTLFFSGTMTWDSESDDPAVRCQGEAAFTGFQNEDRLTLTAPTFPLRNCTSPTNLQWRTSWTYGGPQ